MPSTPLMLSSIGVATVSAITFGLAPGYCARTTTEGGATSGYSEIGITRSASRPATKISTDMTPAKIGRSMKKRDRFISVLLSRRALPHRDRVLAARLQLRPRVHAHRLRRHARTRADPLQAVDDDAFARLQ